MIRQPGDLLERHSGLDPESRILNRAYFRKEKMMHYKNGREAKIGDRVVGKDIGGNPIAGMLVAAYPSSDTCNGSIVPIVILEQYGRTVTLGDCLHIEDFEAK